MHYLSQFAKYTLNFSCTSGAGVLVEANRTEYTTYLTSLHIQSIEANLFNITLAQKQ